jgi:hypothetical protein
MGRPGNLCRLCSGPLRGRSGRRADVTVFCTDCGHGVCLRHAVRDIYIGEYRCSRCEREKQKRG